MIIKDIRVTKTTSSIKISAQIQMQHARTQQELYFKIPRIYESALIKDATPFIAAMLIPCMRNNEDITVENASISQDFLNNTKSLMRKLARWDKQFHTITISGPTSNEKKKKGSTAAFFTGGVDSFYTYLKAKKSKKTRIDTFLFVHGFDIELENPSFFTSVKKGLQKLADEEGVKLITLETNMKRIVERYVEWDWGHGGALASVGLLLRNRLSTVYIAGALRWDQLFPYGTHPDLDPLWGSSSLTFIHDGNEYDRLDKVVNVVGKSKLALKHLRVCNQNLKGEYNCSHCFKCLWTMMTLECAGSLNKSQTFDHTIDLESVKKMRYTFERNYHLAGLRVVRYLKKEKRRKDLQEAILESLNRSKHPNIKQRLAMKIAELDKKYNKRRLYLAVFALNQNQDRSTLFKLLARQGIIK